MLAETLIGQYRVPYRLGDVAGRFAVRIRQDDRMARSLARPRSRDLLAVAVVWAATITLAVLLERAGGQR